MTSNEIPQVFNMASALIDRQVAEGRGDRVAVRFRGREISYRALQQAANRAGHALLRLGIQRENRVAVLLPDCPEFLASFLGAMKAGAVPVPINTLSGPDEYRYYLEDSRATGLVVDGDVWPKIAPNRDALRHLRVILYLGDGAVPPGTTSFQEACAASPAELECAETSRDEPSYWLYSSGTTGRPKGVVHLHRDMFSCASIYARHVLALRPDDVTFSASRLFFSYGLNNSLYLPLLGGASVLLSSERPAPAPVLELLEAERPTLFFAVPTFYAALLQEIERLDRPPDLGFIRLAVSAGEALPAPLYERWVTTTGIELLDGLGSTEAGYIYTSNRPGRVRPGSSGELLPGYEARLLDERGHEAPPGEIGDLFVKGASTAARYWNKRSQSACTFLGEWLRTGDKYTRDEEGFYYYCGRADDLMRVSSQWVAPMEVEAALLEHTAVVECAVVGCPDEAGLERPKAFVVARPGQSSQTLAAELGEFAAGRLARFKVPRWIELVDELPKTATGKIQRFKLRQPA